MHKLTEASFERETGEEGKKETVKGHLAVAPPDDNDYTSGRNIGQVIFIVSNEEEEKKTSETTEDNQESRITEKSVNAPKGKN
jgi:hypothetical protein